MKAIVRHDYGPPDVLRHEDVARPMAGDDEVLIRIRAASLNPLDWHLMRGLPYELRVGAGLRRPGEIRLGVDVAGEIEAVGSRVTGLRAGDAVFGACRGAFAEYACTQASAVVAKPGTLTFEQAAAVNVAARTALQGLGANGPMQPGRTVLINGASGGVGTFAVQIAKAFGASVTGVCGSGSVEMVRALGADHVIDYTRQDFTTNGGRYDLILDCVGNHPLRAIRRVLDRNGAYVIVGGPTGRWMTDLLGRAVAGFILSRFSRQKLGLLMVKRSPEDLTVIRDLLAAGTVTPVIDRRYQLADVPDAIRYLEQGHARGKVVVLVGAPRSS